MELKDIRTRKDFATFLLEWDELEVEAVDLDEVITWFVAMREAESCSEFTQKDLAHLFLNGIEGINANPDTAVENWLQTLWEDVDSMYEQLGQEDEATELEEEVALEFEGMLRRHFDI